MGDEEEKAIGEIKEALGSPEGCKIEKQKSYYIIEPKNSNDKLLIKQLNIPYAFSCNLHFKNCSFEYDIYLIRKTFNSTIKFERCIFKKFVNLNYSKFKTISFIDTIFEDIAYFIGVNFERMVTFSRSRFKERAFFSHSTFKKKASFEEVIFKHNAYFDDVKFLGEADFRLSEFYENAHFYKTKFKELPKENIQEKDIPKFLQAIFNGSINLTDTPLFVFDFENLKSIIKEDSHKANEFRDTFKNMKNALIKDNNLLDASRFHKMELYAKELELEHKETSTTRDFIDRIQLIFYRLTSDHHTDLLLILNNVLVLIVLFSVIVFIVFCRTTCWKYIKEKVFCNSEQDYSYFIELLKIIRGAFIENPACNEIIAIIFFMYYVCVFVYYYII